MKGPLYEWPHPQSPWRPGPDVPTLVPTPTRLWLCNAPCATCGTHVTIATWWLVNRPFCSAACCLKWEEARRHSPA